MSDKKNIDRLFQEKFKDFEVEPNEQIWINIDAALREKKKRRVIPIWFKLTGIAAGLILGFFAFNFLFNDTTLVEENQVVIGNEKQQKENNLIESSGNESVVNTVNSTETNKQDKTGNTVNSSETNQKSNSINNLALENKDTVVNQTENQKKNSSISPKENNAVANTSAKVEKSSVKKKTIRNSITSQDSESAVVTTKSKVGKNNKPSIETDAENINSNSEKNNAVANHNSKIGKNKKGINSVTKSEENNTLAVEDQENLKDNNSSKKNLTNEKKSNTSIALNEKTSDEENKIKTDNFVPIEATTENDLIKKDSTALAAVEPNALEELLKKNEKEEEKKIAEAKMNRWQITSNVAPIYFSSTSNGSPIDAQFAENSKSFENNLSFGVGVNYAVNKKISVRTGVNKFTLGYNTNDVVFFAAMDEVSFGNLASSAAGSTIQVVSENNSEALRPFSNGIQNTNEGIMTQRMGYFEVPVEMSYKLIDKKFGINLIGGVSTLFLNENEVTVSSSTMSASLGKAKNLNDIHFSTNVGLGFKYRFWKSFEANFEPMFKYQINTFNKDAGNFKPYFIGLYSGVSFNF